MAASVIALVRLIRRKAVIARRELRHHLRPAQLQQYVVLGVEMIGRDGIGAGYKDKALRLQHPPRLFLDMRLEFGEQPHQQRGIFR